MILDLTTPSNSPLHGRAVKFSIFCPFVAFVTSVNHSVMMNNLSVMLSGSEASPANISHCGGRSFASSG